MLNKCLILGLLFVSFLGFSQTQQLNECQKEVVLSANNYLFQGGQVKRQDIANAQSLAGLHKHVGVEDGWSNDFIAFYRVVSVLLNEYSVAKCGGGSQSHEHAKEKLFNAIDSYKTFVLMIKEDVNAEASYINETLKVSAKSIEMRFKNGSQRLRLLENLFKISLRANGETELKIDAVEYSKLLKFYRQSAIVYFECTYKPHAYNADQVELAKQDYEYAKYLLEGFMSNMFQKYSL